MKQLAVFGSTGSIGTQTLDVVAGLGDRYQIDALGAGRNMARLAQQIEAFEPRWVAVADEDCRTELLERLKPFKLSRQPQVDVGEAGQLAVMEATSAQQVVMGTSGFAGVMPTLRALELRKQVLTANKETFVTAGHLVAPYLSQVIPLDSEHSAIFQCLQGTHNRGAEVYKLTLTASGGALRQVPLEDLPHVTPQQALSHPNWAMGPRITVDSATMMNKGLEIIEAHHLFGLPYEQIEVVIHPQSIIHSAVSFVDGSMLAQLGVPDMRVPIQYGLSYPNRWQTPFESLQANLLDFASLTFLPLEPTRYPCLALAREAGRLGGTMPVVLNAADEVLVEAFLAGRIGFMEIPRMMEQVMLAHQDSHTACPNWQTIRATDQWTRDWLEALLGPVSTVRSAEAVWV